MASCLNYCPGNRLGAITFYLLDNQVHGQDFVVSGPNFWYPAGPLRLAGVPISCICNHINPARRVAVGAARHAFLALQTPCRVAGPARFVVCEFISSPLDR